MDPLSENKKIISQIVENGECCDQSGNRVSILEIVVNTRESFLLLKIATLLPGSLTFFLNSIIN